MEERISNFGVHNISSLKLTYDQTKTLGYGLKFIPTPKPVHINKLREDFYRFQRSVRCQEYFETKKQKQSQNPATKPQQQQPFDKFLYIPNRHFQPPPASVTTELKLEQIRGLIEACAESRCVQRSNISNNERLILSKFKYNDQVIVRPADKNLGIVVCDREWYKTQVYQTLNDPKNYRQVDLTEVKSVIQRIHDLNTKVFTTKATKLLTSKEAKFLSKKVDKDSAQIGNFYLTIKVHKKIPVGRPILPSHSWITAAASTLVDRLLQVVVQTQLPNVVSSSLQLIRQLESKCLLSSHHNNNITINNELILVTGDVESLYPNIPIDEGLIQLKKVLTVRSTYSPQLIEFIIQLSTVVLKNSYLKFEDTYYHQINGTAMGTAMAPTYANCYMHSLEDTLFNKLEFEQKPKPLLFRRYIDDILIIWNHGPSSLQEFLNRYNNMAPSIRVQWNQSTDQINFLDLELYKGHRFKEKGIIDIRLYQKPMNLYLYIPFKSFHPIETQKGFITGELKRMIRNHSNIKEFQEARLKFYLRLRARGYPDQFLQPLFHSIHYNQRSSLLQIIDHQKSSTEIPLVFITDYNPRIRPWRWRRILKTYPKRVILALRRSKTISNTLCRSQYFLPTKRGNVITNIFGS